MLKPYQLVTLKLDDYATASSQEADILYMLHLVIDRTMQHGTDGDCYNCGGKDGHHINGCIVKDLVELMQRLGEL